MHSRRHSGIRPYQCDMCDKTFRHPTGIRLHKRTHAEEKPYSCTICKKMFSQNSYVHEQMRRIHNNSERIKCQNCDKYFKSAGQMKQHLKRHFEKIPLPCTICHKVYSDIKSLLCHMRNYHEVGVKGLSYL